MLISVHVNVLCHVRLISCLKHLQSLVLVLVIILFITECNEWIHVWATKQQQQQETIGIDDYVGWTSKKPEAHRAGNQKYWVIIQYNVLIR